MATLNAHTFATRDDAEAHYLGLIDEAAAKARRIDPAQAVLYREKATQANAGGGPLLDAEAAALGAAPDTIREAVLSNHEHWQRRTQQIELARLQAKAAVRNAANAAAMHRIYREYQEAL